MFYFGRKSKQVLATLSPNLQRLMLKVIEGYDCSLICGHRNEKDQTYAFVNGASKVPWPKSKHNSEPSMAVDAVPYPRPDNWGKDSRDEWEKFEYFGRYVEGVAAGMGIKIKWGGRWKRFRDMPHFQEVT